MRIGAFVWLVFLATCVVAADGQAPAGDAAAILRDMRAALGGDAVLGAVNAFSADGDVRETFDGRSKTLSIELSVLLPDHVLDVRRDVDMSSPRTIDITYYRGFRGDTLIRRTVSTIRFPPTPGPRMLPRSPSANRQC